MIWRWSVKNARCWFSFEPEKPMPSFPNIVDMVFLNHPRDCVFAHGARERILAKCDDLHGTARDHVVDVLEAAFKAEEIYCPHEGIDRRAEFGIAA